MPDLNAIIVPGPNGAVLVRGKLYSLNYRKGVSGWALNANGTIDVAQTGTAAPTTTPVYVGQMFCDTTNEQVYVATGTTDSGDWKLLN